MALSTHEGIQMAETAIAFVVPIPGGGWRVGNTRVGLDSVIHAYRDGQTVESIHDDFPSLSLAQIHGAIAFYLHNRDEVDRHLVALSQQWDQLQSATRSSNDPLLVRVRARRDALAKAGLP